MENQGERWRDRLEAQGWKAESLILLARMSAEMVDHAASGGLAPGGERLLTEQTTPIDWAEAYRVAPTFLTRILTHLDPSIAPVAPTDDQLVGPGCGRPWRSWIGFFGGVNTEPIPQRACCSMRRCHGVRCNA
jgi:hypothetical protein